MKTEILYKKNTIKSFCENYHIHKDELLKNDLYYFRYICFKYIDFIKHVKIPELIVNSYYEAVLIDFRKFPHMEFLIRNAILKLGDTWSYTVVCGNLNYDYMKQMCDKISPNIKIIKINQDNVLPSQYSELLTSNYFWNLLSGEKIFIYQEDSMIFQNNIHSFLQYDYIGAPFLKNQNDTPNSVGNGGLSLRSKSIMLQIINTLPLHKTKFNSSTLQYMKQTNSTTPPEDVYFSKNMQELAIGKIADFTTASLFSSESIHNQYSFGGHRFWISNPNWKKYMKEIFHFTSYVFNSNLETFLKYNNLNLSLSKTSTITNAFDVDLFFCNNVNKLNTKKKKEIVSYIKDTAINGKIYHPKQIVNIYPDILFYKFLNNIYILHKTHIFTAHKFVNKYLYNIPYFDMYNQLISNKYYHLNKDYTLLLLVFIGNEEKGIDLLYRIIHYKNVQDFNISFCFNSKNEYSQKIKDMIQTNFTYYAIYETREFGTDITPTLLMYEDILTKNHFPHIIKLQTKSIVKDYTELTDYLLSMPIHKLIQHKQNNCNCIGHPNYYISLKKDIFNHDLKIEYYDDLYSNYTFVAGTIFYCPYYVFEKTLNFMKKDFSKYLFNNLYENNSINFHNSPIHFLERVFGTIKI